MSWAERLAQERRTRLAAEQLLRQREAELRTARTQLSEYARNLAEAARELGFQNIHIVSYPIDTLKRSELPLKHPDTISPYSPGITIDRPEPVGDYKVLDGRLGISDPAKLTAALSTAAFMGLL